MTSPKQYTQIVDVLVELTQTKKLKWIREPAPQSLFVNDNRIDQIYKTIFNGRHLRIYKELFRYYTDEDKFYYSERIVLEFTDDSGLESIFQFPSTSNTLALLNSIQYQDADIDSFMHELFEKKIGV